MSRAEKKLAELRAKAELNRLKTEKRERQQQEWEKTKKQWKELPKGVKTTLKTTGAIIILLIVVGILSSDGTKKSQTSSQSNNTAKTTQQSQKEKEEELKQQTPTSTVDQLWEAVDKGIGSRDGVEVKYSDQTKFAELIITKESDNFWDEKAVIQSGYRSFVKWGQEVAEISGPETIEFTLKTDFKDAYGKTSSGNAIQIAMQTENFKKFDWKSLEGQTIASQLQSQQTNELGYLVVHSALRSKLSEAKLFL